MLNIDQIRWNRKTQEDGFTLLEVMVSILILMIITSVALGAVVFMARRQNTQAARSEMHTQVRDVTALMQQEMSQAGAVPPLAAPARTLTTAYLRNADLLPAALVPQPQNVSINSVAGIYTGQYLQVGVGASAELTHVLGVPGDSAGCTVPGLLPTQVCMVFTLPHAIGDPVQAGGVYVNGIVDTDGPTAALGCTNTFTNNGVTTGNTPLVADYYECNTLRMFGDFLGDGSLQLVEYICDPVTTHTLTRKVVTWTQGATAPAWNSATTADNIILDNVVYPPAGGTPACFTFTPQNTNGTYCCFFTNVQIRLTTRVIDPSLTTNPAAPVYAYETRSLLNVNPRNLVDGYAMATDGFSGRTQKKPTYLTTAGNGFIPTAY